MELIICRGIQGSGKSTWAKNWVNERPEQRIRLNNDDIRTMLGPYWIPSRESLVKKILYDSLKAAMSEKFDIVIDNMNLNNKTIEELCQIIRTVSHYLNYDYTIRFQDFKTPLEVCIERDSARANPNGEQIIRNTYQLYESFYK